MRTPEDKPKAVVVGPNFLSSWFVYDYEVCDGRRELEKVMDTIPARLRSGQRYSGSDRRVYRVLQKEGLWLKNGERR